MELSLRLPTSSQSQDKPKTTEPFKNRSLLESETQTAVPSKLCKLGDTRFQSVLIRILIKHTKTTAYC